MPNTLLSLEKINKYYDNLHVLRDVSFTIEHGEFLTLLGPSGCGKTTLLRCISGLEQVDSGEILLNGNSIKALDPNKRNVNTVFQNYALFPHLNVYDNIAYGPRVKKSMTESQIKQRVTEVLDLVQMPGYEERKTDQMSGGQMQRIAIARALINEPHILLLDEPLGALDLKLRKHMQTELAHLQKKTETTFVYVTHDQDEALNMSDRIVVIDHGVVQQLGSPADIYNNPRNLFVAGFIGDRNMRVVEILEREKEFSKVKLANNVLTIRNSAHSPLSTAEKKAILAIHMDKMSVSCDEVSNSIVGEVISIHFAGSQIRIEVVVDNQTITVVQYQNTCECAVGDTVYITWEETGATLLPLEDGWENYV